MDAIKIGMNSNTHWKCPICETNCLIDKLDDETEIHFRLLCKSCDFEQDLIPTDENYGWKLGKSNK